MEYDIEKKVSCTVEVDFLNGGVIDGFFLVGIGIEVTAYTFQPVTDMISLSMGGTLEGCMFTEMSQSGVISIFVLGSGIHE